MGYHKICMNIMTLGVTPSFYL